MKIHLLGFLFSLIIGSVFAQSLDKERDILPYEMERDSYKLKKRIEDGKDTEKDRKELAHMLAFIGVHRYNYNTESFVFFDSAYRMLNKIAIHHGITSGNLMECKPCQYGTLSKFSTADVHRGMAMNYKNNGDYGKAIFHFKCVGTSAGSNDIVGKGLREIYQALGKNEAIAISPIYQTRVAYQKNPTTVLRIQKKLKKIVASGKTLESGPILADVVNRYLSENNPTDAYSYLSEAQHYPRIMRKNEKKNISNEFLTARIGTIRTFGEKLLTRGLYDSAIIYANEALKFNTVRNINYDFAAEYFLLGRAYESKREFAPAAGYFEKYIALDKSDSEPQYHIANFYARVSKDMPAALIAYTKALRLTQESISKIDRLPFSVKKTFIDNHHVRLDELATYASALGKDERINSLLYDLVLSIKIAQLSSSQRLVKFVSSTSDTTVVAMYKFLLAKRNALGKVRSPEELEKAKREIDELEQVLYQKIDDAAPNTVHWTDVKAALTDKEAAVEIVRYNDLTQNQPLYLALVLSADRSSFPEIIPIGKASELDNRSFKFYSNSILSQTADNLSFGAYWEALANACRNARHIYFSPDGVYFKLNIGTLFNPNQKKFVFEYMDADVVLSTRDIITKSRNKSRDPRNEKIVLFGAPDFSGEGPVVVDLKEKSEEVFGRKDRGSSFDYLFGAKKEINTLSGYLSASGILVDAITDQNANEEAFKDLEHPGVLHVATHGFFKELNASDTASIKPDPMFNAGLVMAGVMRKTDADEEDGVLTAFEVSNLNFAKTELVVLSACETGLGEIENGEGVFGLQRAFKIAGANNIIMSLWKVDDEVTQRLMTQFYGFWLSGLEVPTAFYMAQNKIREDYKQPYFWGAFVIF